MEKSLGLLLLLLGLFLSVSEVQPIRNNPRFCTLEAEWEKVAKAQLIGSFSNLDTLLRHELYLLSDSVGQPLLFYADILTPVCIDDICKPVYIELYWDLTGGYAGYGLYEDEPLTKFDHDEFLPKDHQKLHRLLSNNNSILRRKQLSDLFDEQAIPEKKIEYQGVELDAVSGATKKEIKESIVEGALYSCYTLWHLVHGKAVEDIENYLESIYTEELEAYFLQADYEPYNYYALRSMEAAAFAKHQRRIAEIFAVAKPLSRTYLLKKMPGEILQEEEICRKFYQHFSTVDINTKTLLINYLPDANSIAVAILSDHLEEMSKNQLKTYLETLSADASKISPEVRNNLEAIADSQEYAYSYLVAEWLR